MAKRIKTNLRSKQVYLHLPPAFQAKRDLSLYVSTWVSTFHAKLSPPHTTFDICTTDTSSVRWVRLGFSKIYLFCRKYMRKLKICVARCLCIMCMLWTKFLYFCVCFLIKNYKFFIIKN